MGYFSNGTEGYLYYEYFCARCIHEQENRQCAVWTAHLLRNSDECNDKNSILHMLIPRSKDGLNNEKCRMFMMADSDEDADK